MIGEGHCVLPAVTRQPQFENQVEIILLFHCITSALDIYLHEFT